MPNRQTLQIDGRLSRSRYCSKDVQPMQWLSVTMVRFKPGTSEPAVGRADGGSCSRHVAQKERE